MLPKKFLIKSIKYVSQKLYYLISFLAQQQKPRPLLPSQRAALEMQQRAPAFVATQLPGERPKYAYSDQKIYTLQVNNIYAPFRTCSYFYE